MRGKLVQCRELRSLVESSVVGPDYHKRLKFIQALRNSLPDFKSFLEYRGPRAADRSQVLSREVRLPNARPTILDGQDDAPPITLDDQDVQIALKLSDDLNLNEIDCVSLLVTTHEEWGLLGRKPLEILRLSAGLWFTERRAFITILFILLWVAVLDEYVGEDVAMDIQNFLEELFKSGLRQRLITMIKELNREEPTGSGGPHADRYVIDSKAALVQRYHVAQIERLGLSQCLVLSVLVVRIGLQEAKDIVSLLKDCAADTDHFQSIVKLQIAYTIMFGLVMALASEALSGPQDPSAVTFDSDFRREFQETVMSTEGDANIEGFMDVVRFSWAVFMMLTSDNPIGGVPRAADAADVRSCLESDCANNAFKFLTRILRSPAFQVCPDTETYLPN